MELRGPRYLSRPISALSIPAQGFRETLPRRAWGRKRSRVIMKAKVIRELGVSGERRCTELIDGEYNPPSPLLPPSLPSILALPSFPSPLSLAVAGFPMHLVSVAGQETCLVLPREKLAFDIGRCPQRAVGVETVLLTHCHMDHVGGLPFHVASRQLLNLSASRVAFPAPNADALESLMAVHRQLDGCDMRWNPLPSKPGDVIPLKGTLVAKVFPTHHPVPSHGYVICDVRHKLRPEYVGRPGAEIGALRQQGIEVTFPTEAPMVAFTGDTDRRWLTSTSATHPEVFRVRLLIMECTFVDDATTPESAMDYGHLHVDDLVEHVEMFREVGHLLLVHFSARYKRSEVVRELEARIPPWLQEKTSVLLEGYNG